VNASAAFGRLVRLDVVHHAAIFGLRYLGDAEFFLRRRRQPARVVTLATAGGIESSAVEIDAVTGIDFRCRDHLGDLAFKLVEERIVVVEAIRHTYPFYMGSRSTGLSLRPSIGADDSRDLAAGRQVPLLGGRASAEDIEVLQAGAGIEQDHLVVFREEFAGTQLAVGCAGGRAFRRCEDAFYSRPLAERVHDFVVGDGHGGALTLPQNIEDEVITISLRNAQARG